MARVAYRSVLDIRETILLVLGVAEVAEVAEVAVVDAVVDAASDAAAGPASAMCWKSLSRTGRLCRRVVGRRGPGASASFCVCGEEGAGTAGSAKQRS